jgi:hypothetical protein
MPMPLRATTARSAPVAAGANRRGTQLRPLMRHDSGDWVVGRVSSGESRAGRTLISAGNPASDPWRAGQVELNALAGHHIQADRQWSGFFCRSNAGPMRREASALLLCSVDCFPLGFEGEEDMIRMVLDHVILDVAAFGPPLRSSLDVYVRHAPSVMASHAAVFPPASSSPALGCRTAERGSPPTRVPSSLSDLTVYLGHGVSLRS